MSDNQDTHAEWIKRKESVFKFQEVLARATITENTDRYVSIALRQLGSRN